MSFVKRLMLLLRTFNPDQYKKLCQELSTGSTFTNFFLIFLILFSVMLLLFIPAAFFGAPRIEGAINSFDSFHIGGNFTASRPIVLAEHPRIVVDLEDNVSLNHQQLLFTTKGIEWKKWYFFGTSKKPWSDVTNAKQLPKSAYLSLLLFLIPSLAFWGGLFLLFKYIILALIFSVIAWAVSKLLKHQISYSSTLKVSLFSTTVMMTLEMLLFPFYRIFWLPLILYLLFLTVGLLLVGEHRFSEDSHKDATIDKRRRKRKTNQKERAKNIWK